VSCPQLESDDSAGAVMGVVACIVEDMFENAPGADLRSGEDAGAESATAACSDSAALIDRLVVLRSEVARREAEMLTLMAEFVAQYRREDAAGPGADVSEAFAVDELALALVTTRYRVRHQLELAEALGGELSATGALLSSGRIDGYQAWVIHDMMAKLVEPEHVAQVEAKILDRASDLTGGQIRSRLARLIAATEPAAFAARHEQAMADRRVSANTGLSIDQLAGMGSLWFSHAAVDIAAIDDQITRLARQTRDGDGDDARDVRSFDNVRADVARDLLLGRPQPGARPATTSEPGGDDVPEPAGPALRDDGPPQAGATEQAHTDQAADTDQPADTDHVASSSAADPASSTGRSSAGGAQVVVVVPVQTLMGIDDAPGELLGRGPIPAAVARAVASAPDSVWRRMLTDPAGNLVDLSTKSYRPGKVLDLAVTLRDGTSRFPRSNASAVGADFDHTIPYPAGNTCYGNGGKLTRRDHRVKHAPGWRVTQPKPGHFTWRTPTGHTYRTGPAHQPAGTWPEPWQLDPDPSDPDELMTQLARAPDYLDDYLLHELDIDPPDE